MNPFHTGAAAEVTNPKAALQKVCCQDCDANMLE
jgi:hypothetical protein